MKRRRRSITGTLRREGYTKSEADVITRRIRKKAKAKKNPSGSTWLLLGVGAAALGIGAYFLLKPSTGSGSTAKALAPSSSKPFGDPGDQNSTAYACNTAWKLHKLGHEKEAMAWGGQCSQGGATVPQSDAQMYT